MEKKILVVCPRGRINYNQVYPAVIRALDLIRDESSSVRFIVDNVATGTTGLVMEAVNKLEASLLSRGYDVRFLKRPLDVMLHGKKAHSEWIKKHLPDVDAVLVFDSGYSEAKEVRRYCEKNNVPLVRIESKTLPTPDKIR